MSHDETNIEDLLFATLDAVSRFRVGQKEAVSAALEQARLTYSFIREALEPTGEYRWIDSTTRLGATHKASNIKLRSGRRRSTKQAPEKADDPAFAPPPTLTRNQTLPQKRRSFLIVMVPPGTIKPSIRHPQQETSKCPTSSTH